jgi:hypothetical protein
MLKITAKKREGAELLPKGRHQVTVHSISDAVAESENWTDPTEQVKIVYKEKDGNRYISDWLNLKGFKRMTDLTDKEKSSGKFEARSSETGDEEYAVNKKTGARVEDPERTEKCLSIFGEIMTSCGVEDGEERDFYSLVGSELYIDVDTKGSRVIVKRTRSVEEVEA